MRLFMEPLLTLERMGEKLADEDTGQYRKQRKRARLPNLIYGLGIRHIGDHSAEVLAAAFRLSGAAGQRRRVEETRGRPRDRKDVTAESIAEFFAAACQSGNAVENARGGGFVPPTA